MDALKIILTILSSSPSVNNTIPFNTLVLDLEKHAFCDMSSSNNVHRIIKIIILKKKLNFNYLNVKFNKSTFRPPTIKQTLV